MGPVPVEFFAKWHSLAAHIGSVTPSALAIGVAALVILVFWPRVSHRVPAPFVALIATTAIAAYFHLPVAMLGAV